MVQSVASEIGTIIGQSIKQSKNYKEDFIETDNFSDISLTPVESVNLRSSYFVYKQNLGNHFTLDHPVNGVLNSSTLQLDTGLGSRDLFSSGEVQL